MENLLLGRGFVLIREDGLAEHWKSLSRNLSAGHVRALKEDHRYYLPKNKIHILVILDSRSGVVGWGKYFLQKIEGCFSLMAVQLDFYDQNRSQKCDKPVFFNSILRDRPQDLGSISYGCLTERLF